MFHRQFRVLYCCTIRVGSTVVSGSTECACILCQIRVGSLVCVYFVLMYHKRQFTKGRTRHDTRVVLNCCAGAAEPEDELTMELLRYRYSIQVCDTYDFPLKTTHMCLSANAQNPNHEIKVLKYVYNIKTGILL